MNKRFFIFILFFISVWACGQIEIGQWSDHYCYTKGRKVVFAKDDVYLMTNQSLLKYNLKNSEVETISKVQGLSDSKISCIEFCAENNYLIIGYNNGNVDLLKNNEIVNINEIKQKQMVTDKTINSIKIFNNIAYLGTSFGIVSIDLDRKEIKDTWFIGNNGSFLKINEILVFKNNIYATTDVGIYKGDLTKHLADFSNWEIITDNNYGNPRYDWLSGKSFDKIIEYKDKIIVNCYNDKNTFYADTLLIFNGNEWTNFAEFKKPFSRNYDLSTNGDNILIIYWNATGVFDANFKRIREVYGNFLSPKNAVFNPNDANLVAIADDKQGLFFYQIEGDSYSVNSNSPISENIFHLATLGNTIYGIAGAYNSGLNPTYSAPIVYKYDKRQWSSLSSQNIPEIEPYHDLVSIAIDPYDSKHFFCGSWDRGLLEFKDDKLITVYNTTNSTLSELPGYGYIRVNCLNFDSKGNFWCVTSESNPSFHCLDKNNKWHSFNFSSVSGRQFVKMIITKDGTKWVLIKGKGLFVFNENGTFDDSSDDQFKFLSIQNENGEQLNNDALSIAEDDDGYIWIGTANGVAVYYDARSVFTRNITARQIKVPRNNGTNEADLLLDGEAISDIVVDAANKKWFGTQNSGVFYTSPDGLEQILNFNIDNSPLPDNFINSITISAEGEVFFGTAAGIISYRNLSAAVNEGTAKVYTFPNPVEHDYDGPIAITNLMQNSFVKITDLSGNLVYETISEGGQAIWYGKNARGKRVATGIYLVFVTSKDGTESLVTKILFIN